eukprot:g2526.t1
MGGALSCNRTGSSPAADDSTAVAAVANVDPNRTETDAAAAEQPQNNDAVMVVADGTAAGAPEPEQDIQELDRDIPTNSVKTPGPEGMDTPKGVAIGRITPPGTHEVTTTWLYSADAQLNRICGSGKSNTTLTVSDDPAQHDGATGFIIVAEGKTGILEDLTLTSAATTFGQTCWLWKGSTLICRNVHFKASPKPWIVSHMAESVVVLDGCTFDPGASVKLGDRTTQLRLGATECVGLENLQIEGSPSRTWLKHAPGTHEVTTTWLYSADAQLNRICGSGKSNTTLTVSDDPAQHDGATGFIIVAEGKTGILEDLTLTSAATTFGQTCWLWKGSTLICRNVHFKASPKPLIGTLYEGCEVIFEQCSFDPGCEINFNNGNGKVRFIGEYSTLPELKGGIQKA